MAKGLKDGLTNSNSADGIVTYDGTYVYVKVAGTTKARMDSNGSLSINGGLTDNAGL